jgi:hypothetical protein
LLARVAAADTPARAAVLVDTSPPHKLLLQIPYTRLLLAAAARAAALLLMESLAEIVPLQARLLR